MGEANAIATFLNGMEAVKDLLAESANFILPFATFSISIKGVFNGPDDSFDSSRHQIIIQVSASKELRDALRQDITVSKQEAVIPAPNLIEYMDFNNPVEWEGKAFGNKKL